MHGDVLFWTGAGSLTDRIISWATKGPYFHVSVDLGDGSDIGAHSEDGIKVRPLPSNLKQAGAPIAHSGS